MTTPIQSSSPVAQAILPAPKDRFIRHANLMSGLTILSRVFGLLRDKLCATYLGNKTTEWAAFWMGFQLPNLFRRIFGEGALTAIFVPAYTRVLHTRSREEANRLAAATSTLLVLFLGGLTLLGEVIFIPLALSPHVLPSNRLAAAMIAIQLPYCVMVCLVALFGAMATVHERFTAQSLSPIILNIAMAIAAVLPVLLLTRNYPLHARIFWVAFAVIFAGLLQIVLMLPTLLRSHVRISPTLAFRQSGVGEIVRAMVPMMLGLSAVQLNTFMDSQIAWWLSQDGHNGADHFQFFGRLIHTPMQSGALGVLSVAQRLYMLPVGIFGVSMATAIFPLLSKAAVNNDIPEVKRLLAAGLRKTLFLSLPASFGMILVARYLILLVYAADVVDRAAWAAIWFCAGIWAFECQLVILRVFYALGDRITPMKLAVGMVLLNFTLNLTLVWHMREGGLAASTTFAAIVQSLVLLLILRKRLGRLHLKPLLASIAKGLIACAAMLIVCLPLMHFYPPLAHKAAAPLHYWLSALSQLTFTIAAAVVTYGIVARTLGMQELFDLPILGRFLKPSR